MKQSTAGVLLTLTCVLGFISGTSSELFNVTKIKGSRDEVPAQEVLDLIKPHLKSATNDAKKAKEITSLIDSLWLPVANSKSYFLFDTNAVSWYGAYCNCIKSGLEFATVNSANEQLQIIQLIYKQGQTDELYWIGGTDGISESNWMWVGGNFTCSNSPVTFTYWMEDGDHSDNGLNCLATFWGAWSDVDCDGAFNYICQSV